MDEKAKAQALRDSNEFAKLQAYLMANHLDCRPKSKRKGLAGWALDALRQLQPQAAEPKGLTDEQRSAIRSASLNSHMTTAQRDCLRALLSKGE